MGNVVLKANDIKKTYSNRRGDNIILDGFNINIEEGKMYAISGESGSGKSTLISILAGLQKPDCGKVTYISGDGTEWALNEIDDNALTKLRRHDIVYVPQMQDVLTNINVRDNICLIDNFEKKDKKQANDDIKKLALILDELGISELAYEYPSELSGGELRRLCIARTLYANPKVILADEPTNDLDKNNRDKLEDIFMKIRDNGVAVVVATHDSDMIMAADERIQLY